MCFVESKDICLVETQDMCCVELGHVLCSEPIQRKPRRGLAEARPPMWWRPEAAASVLALNKAHVLVLNTAHALRLNTADVLALNKVPVVRLNTKICSEFTANINEAAFGRLHKEGRPLVSFVLAVNTGHILGLVETQDMCCVES